MPNMFCRSFSANVCLQKSFCRNRPLITKDDEPFLLDDPARLKALTHPMRRLMLRHLKVHGPATSTTLGELLGAKTGTTSYHLRLLEKYTHRVGDAPPDARPLYIRLFALPADEE